ncbi:MAG: heavy-metal-associated domain-containing protein, partial [Muribaculaceae bacterium]|nr:heavy-metal-associated domain-containing protein [Muribaculaceae bacterium]
TVKGMTCAHCKAMVEKNVAKLPGVNSGSADRATGKTTIAGNPDPAALREVIDDLGFTLV